MCSWRLCFTSLRKRRRWVASSLTLRCFCKKGMRDAALSAHGLQHPLDQGMHDLLLRGHREKLLFDAVAVSQHFHLIAASQVVVHELGRRKGAHATGAESLQQGAVLEFAHHLWPDRVTFQPVIQPIAHGGMLRWQENGNFSK